MTRERQLALISYQLTQAGSILLESQKRLDGVRIQYDLDLLQAMSKDILMAAGSIQRGIEQAPLAPPVPQPFRPRQ